MRLLLDTHVYFWAVFDGRKLSRHPSAHHGCGRSIRQRRDHWEASIKAGLGKLNVDVDDLVAEISAADFVELPGRGRATRGQSTSR